MDHETGKGQHAFAPRRRDMTAYRAEQEKFRVDQKAEELRQTIEDRAAYQSADAALVALDPSTSPKMPPPPLPPVIAAPPVNAIAGLRISQPRIAVPGLRVAVPRPRVPLATPASIAAAAAIQASPTPLQNDVPPVALSSLSSLSATTGVEPSLLPSHLCSSYFVEPMSWMNPALIDGALAGKLFCPNTKCLAKLGSFDWAGSRELDFDSALFRFIDEFGVECSCGAWVCPGFAIGVAKVDEIA